MPFVGPVIFKKQPRNSGGVVADSYAKFSSFLNEKAHLMVAFRALQEERGMSAKAKCGRMEQGTMGGGSRANWDKHRGRNRTK
jgi:hypothetical protein